LRERGVIAIDGAATKRDGIAGGGAGSVLKELIDWSPREIARVTDEDSGKAMVLVRLSVPYK